jgi:ribosomal protein S18 acetylase RimI-like enzyme
MQLTRSSSFRTATLADAPELAEMNHRLIHDEGHRNPMTVEELRVRMQGWLRGEHEAAVFEQDGRIAGYALFQRQPEHVYLRQFFVRPECRRQGLGRAAFDWLRSHQWRGARVRLDVLVGNETGIAFWKAMNFRDYSLTLELEAGPPLPEP